MPVINVIKDLKEKEPRKEEGRVRPIVSRTPKQFYLTEEAIEAVKSISSKECDKVREAAATLIETMKNTANFRSESKILKEVIMEQMIPSIQVLSDFNYVPREQEDEYLFARSNMLLNIMEMYNIKGIEPRYN